MDHRPRQAPQNGYAKNNPGLAYTGPSHYPQLTPEVTGVVSPWTAARVYDYTRLAVLLLESQPAAINAVATRLKTSKRTSQPCRYRAEAILVHSYQSREQIKRYAEDLNLNVEFLPTPSSWNPDHATAALFTRKSLDTAPPRERTPNGRIANHHTTWLTLDEVTHG